MLRGEEGDDDDDDEEFSEDEDEAVAHAVWTDIDPFISFAEMLGHLQGSMPARCVSRAGVVSACCVWTYRWCCRMFLAVRAGRRCALDASWYLLLLLLFLVQHCRPGDSCTEANKGVPLLPHKTDRHI